MVVVYIVAAILVFGFLIMIHEFGHFIVARKCGVFIKEFSIGMGPKLYQKKNAKTDMLFSIRALPIGGYVSMKGEDEEENAPDSFSTQKVWKRMLIVVAGATMNLLLGFLVVLIIVLSSKNLVSTTIGAFTEDAVSNQSLAIGDTVKKVGSVRVYTGEELTYEVMNQGATPVDVTVIRDGKEIILSGVQFQTFEEQGILFGSVDFRLYALDEAGIGTILSITWHRTVLFGRMVLDSLINLLAGKYPITALSGPIGVTSAVEQTISQSDWNGYQIFQYVLYITGLISVNLGVFNLIPFPALDGGRFFFLLLEAIFRKRIPAKIEAAINFAGIVLLMALMVFVGGKDIFNLFA